MREIKFRAWFTRDETYVKPMSIQNIIHQKVSEFSLSVLYNECVFEEFTGLKDKNGVEIYEGDVVQPVRTYNNFPEIEPTKIGLPLEVKSGGYVYGKWIAREINESGFGVNDYQFSKELEVIGNIHKQPELLEEK